MAFLDASLLNDLQVSGIIDDNRYSEQGIIDAVKASTPSIDYVPQEAKDALKTTSSLRNVDVPVIKDQTVTVVTDPGFNNIPANLEETDTIHYQAYDVFSGLRHYPAAYGNNQVRQMEAFQTKMKKILYSMANTVEGILAARLEERKTQTLDFLTQVSQGDGTYTFNSSTDILSISKEAQKETMFGGLTQLMQANELPGSYRVVTNRGGTYVQKRERAKYGSNNNQNLQALEFFGMDRLHESGNISHGSDVFNGWLLRDGSIGVIPNHPYDFMAGTEVNGKKWSVSDTELPFLKMQCNVYTNTEASDGRSLISSGNDTNLTMTHFEEMAIWCRFYVLFDYNSSISTRAQDIVKIKGLTS